MARLDFVDLRGAITDKGQPPAPLLPPGALQRSGSLVGGGPADPVTGTYQEALVDLLGESKKPLPGVGPQARAVPPVEEPLPAAPVDPRPRGAAPDAAHGPLSYERLGVLNRIERAWHDSCAIPPYLTVLADQLLDGACERADRFSARDWWLLQLAERANSRAAMQLPRPVTGAASGPEPAAGPVEVAPVNPRCVVGPPLTPSGCQPKPWVPVDTPAASSP